MDEEKKDYSYHFHEHHHSNPVWAMIFIVLGVLLLFSNLGWIPWSAWQIVWLFWPVILVIWGLKLLLGPGWLSRFVITIVTVVVAIAIVIYIILSGTSPASGWFRAKYPKAPTPTYVSPYTNWN